MSSRPPPPRSARRCAGDAGSNSPKSCSNRGASADAAARSLLCQSAPNCKTSSTTRQREIDRRLATERLGEAIEIAREIAKNVAGFAPYWDVVAVAAEAFVAAGLLDEAEAMVRSARSHQTDLGVPFLDEAEGRVLLARGEAVEARRLLTSVAEQAAAREFRLVEWRARTLAAEAIRSQEELAAVIVEADDANAVLIRDAARDVATRLGLDVPEPAEPSAALDGGEPEFAQSGERLVTMLFADVRGYTALSATTAPADLAERIGTLHRWAAAEVSRQHGFVDKFAGDAVMATFNATGTRLDHAREALEAALALSGKATLLDLGVGIGIAVGPAVVGRTVAGGNVSVLGPTTNLAARLQTAAEAGEIVLSEEAHRRVAQWLEERGLEAVPADARAQGLRRTTIRVSTETRDDLAQLREDREVCAILRSFHWVVANVGLAAFELSQSKHTCAHTGQFCELGTRVARPTTAHDPHAAGCKPLPHRPARGMSARAGPRLARSPSRHPRLVPGHASSLRLRVAERFGRGRRARRRHRCHRGDE